jgi:hypothetical protein
LIGPPISLRGLPATVSSEPGLGNKAIKPLLAAAQELRPSRQAQNPRVIDNHYDDIRLAMKGVFQELGIAA